ncbi:MAG: hypothetical protein ACRDWT_09395 [Jatrophihabitantaceae bacterium]
MDLLVALNTVFRPRRWEQPIATVALGVAGTALASAGILSHVQTLLNDAGDIIIPFTFVMLVDWIGVQRKATGDEEFSIRRLRRSRGQQRQPATPTMMRRHSPMVTAARSEACGRSPTSRLYRALSHDEPVPLHNLTSSFVPDTSMAARP